MVKSGWVVTSSLLFGHLKRFSLLQMLLFVFVFESRCQLNRKLVLFRSCFDFLLSLFLLLHLFSWSFTKTCCFSFILLFIPPAFALFLAPFSLSWTSRLGVYSYHQYSLHILISTHIYANRVCVCWYSTPWDGIVGTWRVGAVFLLPRWSCPLYYVLRFLKAPQILRLAFPGRPRLSGQVRHKEICQSTFACFSA